MEKIAVFPGSFDPITLGHLDIIERSAPLFDKVIVAIGNNSTKNYMFNLEKRKKWLEGAIKIYSHIEVDSYDGLTIDYCLEKKAKYIIRGLRNPADFEFEKAIAHTNRKLTNQSLETVFFLTSAGKSFISSSIVREIIKYNGNYEVLVPDSVKL